mmetsp:Transcript_23367/g.35377  ORF Transcript_23367/g.35377 Transcript_23367/m.35377 type:complete len:341 (-) Transcript_23367:1509-2531(-)|eukprot:CAMPEP_0194199660 /NCGR_PEP_ID=MMETSP0156-20130528/595_1 /TAXON_ID=33649 /ORGANISM="Thalassionema nitzschioides, Strain L26-B" /LENGTH=340 /DNA_ID=CAMNT_0038924591 /DNA_START=69 /DNA_END=1091 /DNA_ORIENTATION=-
MKLQVATIILLVSSSNGFTPFSKIGVARASGGALYSSSAQEFIKKQQDAANKPIAEEEEAPKLYSDELYADIQNCLLTLEKRAQEGPGCLGHPEVDEFAKAAARILQDMKDQATALDKRVGPGERQARAEAAAVEAAKVAELEGKSPDEIEKIAKAAFDEATAAMIPKPSDKESQDPAKSEDIPVSNEGVAGAPTESVDTPSDEYDGKTFGVAKGTANTYSIPGMEEMTAEEYQKALEQAVIERAAKRRYGMSGRHGNQQTIDYMASLSGGKDANVFKVEKKDEIQEPAQTELYPQQVPQNKGKSKNEGVIDTPDDDDYYSSEVRRREAQAKKAKDEDME